MDIYLPFLKIKIINFSLFFLFKNKKTTNNKYEFN